MHRIKKKVDQLKALTADRISQDTLDEYGLRGITLRPYQLDGVTFIRQCYDESHGCLLGDEMGLGKTIQVISSILHLKGSKKLEGLFLVLCPLSVLANWKSEFERFASNLKVISLVGDKDEREEIKHTIRYRPNKQKSDHGNISSQFDVILTTYEICLREVSFLRNFHWTVLTVDEAHRLKNSKSLLHQELTQFKKDFTILLTGTPVQNNLNELYSLMSFTAPSVFEPELGDEFLESFADVETSSGRSSDLQYLLAPFLLRRVKSEVMKDLPQKSEVILYTGITELQKKYYKGILTKDLGAFSNNGSGKQTSLKNILVHLRKCVNHPYLFDGVEPEPFVLGDHLITASGKLQLLDKLLTFLHKREHKVLVFSQMTRMLDILQDYLGYRGFTYERLDGSVRGEERYLAIRNFNETEDTFVFLLSTRAGGQGVNLTSADTVIFVDSDFNPQNDLQAAARAHRIGQTRPVKIIRLVSRNTVEEIILKRADDKLKLTNNVIEGGQFSSVPSGSNHDTNIQLSDILKFGLDKLFDLEENTISEKDFERILGKSSRGKWSVESEREEEEMEVETTESEAQSMYVYEGRDYSKEASDQDKTAFSKMVAEMRNEVQTSERALRSVRMLRQPFSIDLPTSKRKPLTPGELEERRKKRDENSAKRAKLKEEKEELREEARKKKLEILWRENNYRTLNISLNESDEEEEDALSDEEEDRLDIQYVKGDVTTPIKTNGNQAIIVHCVDDSGYWGQGGLFTAISRRSKTPENHYELAGAMEDLHLGDAHLIPFNEDDEEDRHDYLSLIVAQTRDRHSRLLPMNLAALSEGLGRVSQAAKQFKATVHLPRIGHSTPGFNWYGTERLIRKHLASRGIPTYIYYFASHQPAATQVSPRSSEENNQSSTKRRHNVAEQTTPTRLLPDFFSGVRIFYGDVPREKAKRLSRYVIAYNGDVVLTMTDDVTHVVCDKKDTNMDDIPEGVATVTTQWLEDCIRNQRLENTSKYSL